MTAQIAMMSVAGREEITVQTMRLLLERAAFPEACAPTLYYCAPLNNAAPDVAGWRVERIELDVDAAKIAQRFSPSSTLTNPWLDFKRVLDSWTPGVDALFFEDDLSPCRNSARRMLEHELPGDAGLVSYFDLRNEWPRPGLHVAPAGRDFWGSQAVRIPGHVIGRLQELAARGTELRAWDVWLGRAVPELGLRVYHYSPSLFQHVGVWSLYAPGGDRPVADNYPGDDFDALGECPYPIVRGPSVAPIERRCGMHGIVHPNGQFCG